MLFSERYGYKKINETLLRENVPERLRTRIWNVFYKDVFMIKRWGGVSPGEKFLDPVFNFVIALWDRFFKKNIQYVDEHKYHPSLVVDEIKHLFFQLPWYEVYDFIEFFAQFPWESFGKDFLIKKIIVLTNVNQVLQEEKAPYRIINGIVTPLTSEEEIKEIEKALSVSDKFKPVRDHLEKALRLMSDRKDPDYENSIKESISALESLVKILTRKEGSLSGLIERLDIHQAMKRGFKELYDWTSKEGGIRHGKSGKSLTPGFAEARYMLITISAFVNYLIEKLGNERNNDTR